MPRTVYFGWICRLKWFSYENHATLHSNQLLTSSTIQIQQTQPSPTQPNPTQPNVMFCDFQNIWTVLKWSLHHPTRNLQHFPQWFSYLDLSCRSAALRGGWMPSLELWLRPQEASPELLPKELPEVIDETEFVRLRETVGTFWASDRLTLP